MKKLSAGSPLGIVPQAPAACPAAGEPAVSSVDSPFIWNCRETERWRRKYYRAVEIAIAAIIAAVMGWGFWFVTMYGLAKGIQ